MVMHYLFYHNLGGNIRGGLQYLLCCDEANMLIRTDKEWLGPSPLDEKGIDENLLRYAERIEGVD